MRHPLLVEGRLNCVRQSLASTVSAPRVAATSYCDPGRHANVITPCFLTPCLNVPNTPLLRAMGFLVSHQGRLGAMPPPPFLIRKVWVSIKFLSAKFGLPPPLKGPKMRKTVQISRKSSKLTLFPGGAGTQLYGQNDFMDIWASLILISRSSTWVPKCGGSSHRAATGTSYEFYSGSRKRGVEFKGGSRHDCNRHDRRNRQNRQNRHGLLIVLYFVGQAKEGKVLSRTAKTVKTAKTVMKATPLKLNPPFP